MPCWAWKKVLPMLQRSEIKYIQRLAHKKFREEQGEFVVEGPKLVSELLRWKPGILKGLFGLAEWMEANPALLDGVPDAVRHVVTPSELEALSSMETPNQVLALASCIAPATDLKSVQGPVLALEDIRDPGNLGTILRTADWFGLGHVVCSPTTVELHNPKVVQASMGSVFRVEVHETDLSGWLGRLKGVPILGAALEGESVYGLPHMAGAVVVIGNESHGLSEGVLEVCTRRITIPRVGRAESLNASVATGIILSHLLKGG